MSNIRSNQRHNLKLHCDNSEYWDFFIDRTNIGSYDLGGLSDMYDECLISYIDFSDERCVEGEDAVSVPEYKWEDAVNTGHTFANIGYTGVDNGFVKFRKDMVSNEEFVRIYSESEYKTVENDFRLRLKAVSGNTMEHTYPYEFKDGYAKLNGGYFQGFFMDNCDTYKILPDKLEDTWHFEFVIRPMDYEEPSDSVNNKHPENKGIFFYIGVRGENKWYKMYNCGTTYGKTDANGYLAENGHEMNEFNGDMTPSYGKDFRFDDEDGLDDYIDFDDDITKSEYDEKCCGGDCDYISEETAIDENGFSTSDGLTIGRNNQYAITTDNKYISFDRTCEGFKANTYERETLLKLLVEKREYPNNAFLLFDRACGGFTAMDAHDLPSKNSQYDIYGDIADNCLAFRVTDEGAIGYRLVTKDCDSESDGHLSVLEGYSFDGIVKKGEWNSINVRVRRINGKMCLYFYVNGKLKYVTDELPLINLRKLKENDSMAEGVAYNMSLGGGTQGLMETIMPNYMWVNDVVEPIEKSFCGSFIGDIRLFRFFDCRMESLAIKHNAVYDNGDMR